MDFKDSVACGLHPTSTAAIGGAVVERSKRCRFHSKRLLRAAQDLFCCRAFTRRLRVEARGNGTSSSLNDIFRQFHSRHLDAQGEKLRYTAVFNRFLEAIIDDPGWDLSVRGLAWMARQCWGNDSDYPIEKINGEELGQTDFAKRVGVAKQRASEVFQVLYDHGYLTRDGHRVYLSDNPAETAKSNKNGKKSGALRTFSQWFEDWKVRAPSDFLEFQSAEARYFQLKKVLLRQWRAEKVGRTNGAAKDNFVIEDNHSSSAVEISEAPPPPPEKADEDEGPLSISSPPTPKPPDLYAQLKEAYPHPDEHFDDDKAGDEFLKLTPADRQLAVDRLRDHFAGCARWQDEDGRWIPLASNFLKEGRFRRKPPPPIRKPQSQANKPAPVEDVVKLMQERREREARRRGSA